jgi:hypothetical protein
MALKDTSPPPYKVIETSKDEEGSARGEGWAVLRAFLLLVGGLILVGYVIT